METTIADAMTQAARLQQAGQFDEAENIYRAVLEQMPDNAFALNYLGLIRFHRGDRADGTRLMRASIQADPTVAHFHSNLAGVLLMAGDAGGAEQAARDAIAIDPNLAQAHLDLGLAIGRLGRAAEAIQCLQHAVGLAPNRPDVHTQLGTYLRSIGWYFEAGPPLQRAVELQPQRPGNWVNLGDVLLACQKPADAVAAFSRALALDPQDPFIHYNLALALLSWGNWEPGWREYEWRLKLPARQPLVRDIGVPRWDGAPLDGRSILLYGERGLGESIQFVRYAKLVAERGGKVLLECQPDTFDLFRHVAGVSQAVRPGETPSGIAFHCPLPSLPGLFATTPQTVPAEVPYLAADTLRVQAWDKIMGEREGKLRVGLIASATATRPNDSNRAIPLEALTPLAGIGGVKWLGLQALPLAGVPEGLEIVDLSYALTNLGEIAAALSNVDLLITVDGPAAHLAGAMGREVWTLLPFAAEWRWMVGRPDTPWYPTMRLFRQRRPGVWSDPVEGVAGALRERASKR